MHKRILNLVWLICMASFAQAQDEAPMRATTTTSNAWRYEYWIDSDYSGHTTKTVKETMKYDENGIVTDNTARNIGLNLDVSKMEKGLHILNFRVNMHNEWSELRRYLFYISDTTVPVETGTITEYQYWIDDNSAQKVSKYTSSNTFTLTLDITNLDCGLHFFNIRTRNSLGEWSELKRYMFYKTEVNAPEEDATITEYEYWFDDNYAQHKTVAATSNNYVASIPINRLGEGLHYFNFRAKNSYGLWSELLRVMFMAPAPSGEDGNELLIVSTNDGFVTYCSSNGLDLTNFEAYIISHYDGDIVYLSRIEKAPANTGLILRAEAGSYDIPITADRGYVTNMLRGVTTDTTIQPTDGSFTNFLLAKGNKGVGFYRVKEAGTLAAHKAYLQLPTTLLENGAKYFQLRFDDGTTGMSGVMVSDDEESMPYYDLQGRRYDSKPTIRGIYMQGGKKVVVR